MPQLERDQDRILLKRLRAGDRDALTEIYRLHSKPVFQFALHMAADEVKAAEVMQDVFVWLIHHPRRWDPDRGLFRSFLLGVARMMLKRRRSEEQRWMPLEEASFLGNPFIGRDEAQEDADNLRRAILKLPDRYREVVVLCDLEEKTYEEAAVVLECSIGTIRSRLHRARALLARKLIGKGCTA
jgi:RNA polymerase sigma-70 factor (ECF subfamily)